VLALLMAGVESVDNDGPNMAAAKLARAGSSHDAADDTDEPLLVRERSSSNGSARAGGADGPLSTSLLPLKSLGASGAEIARPRC